jgi:2-desacetyl-2-hydroxyethyl bacteriochlorophyllide A dehydrogenase
MKAARLHGPRDLRVESVRDPRPEPGQVIVRMTAAGLCGTDYEIYSGARPVEYPRIMGHELVGRVEAAAPDVTRVGPGDPVVVEPNYSCGHCPLCREGNRNLCLSRTTIGISADGGFAELVRVPAQCCWRASPGAGSDALLLAEPLAVVVRAVARAEPKSGETAAIVGAGTLGLLALQLLQARGARVMVTSRSRRRFALASELGADATHATVEGPLADAARRFSGREGVDLVVETAGTAEAVTHALELVRPGGRVVLTGLPHEPTSLSFFSVVRREVTLIGSMIYQNEFPEALRLVEGGAVRTAPLITHRFGLDRIDEAFAAHADPSSIKVALEI